MVLKADTHTQAFCLISSRPDILSPGWEAFKNFRYPRPHPQNSGSPGKGLHMNFETLPWRFWCAARTGNHCSVPTYEQPPDIATWTWPLHGVEASSCIRSPVITTHIIAQKGDLAVTPDVFLPLLLILNQQFHQFSHISPSFPNPRSTGLPSISLSPRLYTLLCSLRNYP